MKTTTLKLSIILTLLMLLAAAQFTDFSSANFFPDPGPDLPRIYIKSNGDIEPSTAPIERSGNLYKLTGNIVQYTIEIQRDNVVLDGADYAIQGNASRIKGYDDGNNGIIIVGRHNVNITRLNFELGDAGIRVSNSANIKIINNRFSNDINRGIVVKDSSFVLIESNVFADIAHDLPSISLNGSRNTIINNVITGSIRAIEIEGSSNVISNNRIESVLPIILDKAHLNMINRNIITGSAPSQRMSDRNYTGNEGIALFRQCSNNIISLNNITGFVNQAIRLAFDCSNNTIYGNYLGNNQFAIALQERATNNKFYGNTFAADSCNISIHNSEGNFWDNGTIGNYWGNYKGVDRDGDGIGDTPYKLDGYMWDLKAGGFVSAHAGQDNYPLMAPHNVEHEAVVVPQNKSLPAILIAFTVALVAVAGLLIYRKKKPL
ncbi:MAG: right-handed parallel beta-helix repeat-containing protein [Candidatus Bathyarchaeota archaeon]|nr:right-handed parallel beta-helix repeat-containing protein [Candidatus Bathyarchaeota archaeon]